MFKVMDLAWFILRRCSNNGTPISNLHLQKILFFLQRDSLQNSGSPLFSESIEAWQYGPVIPTVYNNFSYYSAMPIIPTNSDPNPQLGLSANLIKKIDNLAEQNPWSLVERTHVQGGAWDRVFNDGLGNRKEIPLEWIGE